MFTQMSPAMQGFFCHLLNKECILLTWHYPFSTDNYYPDILYALIMYSFVICLIIHCMSKWKLDSKVGEHCFSIYFVQSIIFYLSLQYYLAHEGSNYKCLWNEENHGHFVLSTEPISKAVPCHITGGFIQSMARGSFDSFSGFLVELSIARLCLFSIFFCNGAMVKVTRTSEL